jgi:hypothetical protein
MASVAAHIRHTRSRRVTAEMAPTGKNRAAGPRLSSEFHRGSGGQVREGQVANRTCYIAVAVTTTGNPHSSDLGRKRQAAADFRGRMVTARSRRVIGLSHEPL